MAVIDDIGQHIHNHSIGVLGTSLFKAYLPETPNNAICVLDTGGTEPDPELELSNPTFQIFVRNTSYATGKAKMDAIKDLLHQTTNTQVVPNGIYFYLILAIQEPTHIGRNTLGQHEFSMNFACKIRQ